MFKKGLKGLLVVCTVFLLSGPSVIMAEPRAIDYSVKINSDFTDGVTIKSTHMCGNCKDADDLTVILDDGVPYHHKSIIDNMVINKIPKGVIDSFRYSGHKLALTSKDIREYEGEGLSFEPAGVYSSITKTLYLSNKYDNYWAEQSLVHEFGHYLDYAMWSIGDLGDRASRTPEFKDIWSSERGKFVVDSTYNLDYYQSSVTEYFAQAFDEYVTKPERLKTNTPKTYNYIKKCLYMVDMSVCGAR